jgi:hypothetical protein
LIRAAASRAVARDDCSRSKGEERGCLSTMSGATKTAKKTKPWD